MARRGKNGRFEKSGGRRRRSSGGRARRGGSRRHHVHSLSDIAALVEFANGALATDGSGKFELSPLGYATKGQLGNAGKSLLYVVRNATNPKVPSTAGMMKGVAIYAGGKLVRYVVPAVGREIRVGRHRFRLVG